MKNLKDLDLDELACVALGRGDYDWIIKIRDEQARRATVTVGSSGGSYFASTSPKLADDEDIVDSFKNTPEEDADNSDSEVLEQPEAIRFSGNATVSTNTFLNTSDQEESDHDGVS